jgi:hypothetical protein
LNNIYPLKEESEPPKKNKEIDDIKLEFASKGLSEELKIKKEIEIKFLKRKRNKKINLKQNIQWTKEEVIIISNLCFDLFF